MCNLLLLSNSTMPGTPFFSWPRPWVQSFLGNQSKKLVFIPFAAVTFSWDEYEAIVSKAFAEMSYDLSSVHKHENKIRAIEEADGIVVGGGNTFALLSEVYSHKLLEVIQKKVAAGTPYIGWSAGSNLACPTIKTTNDMPIVAPPSLDALNLVPFQINPHYHELKFEGQGGETRKDRLEEFLVKNPDMKVIGLPEGMLVERRGSSITIKGMGTAKLYAAGQETVELVAESQIMI